MMCWPGSVPPWACPCRLALADDIAFLAVAGADALGVVAVAEVRQLDPADGDLDQVLALLADQLALGEELAQVVADPALDDLPEALVIFFDLQDHAINCWSAFALAHSRRANDPDALHDPAAAISQRPMPSAVGSGQSQRAPSLTPCWIRRVDGIVRRAAAADEQPVIASRRRRHRSRTAAAPAAADVGSVSQKNAPPITPERCSECMPNRRLTGRSSHC